MLITVGGCSCSIKHGGSDVVMLTSMYFTLELFWSTGCARRDRLLFSELVTGSRQECIVLGHASHLNSAVVPFTSIEGPGHVA